MIAGYAPVLGGLTIIMYRSNTEANAMLPIFRERLSALRSGVTVTNE